MHSYSDTPGYFDLVDYGPDQWFCGQARYDLFGTNPATNASLCQPVKDKLDVTSLAAFKSLHGPSEDLNKLSIRTDSANELTASIETAGAYALPTTPHRPNSNKAERSILTFSDLLRVHLLRSCMALCFRPMLAIVVCQLWNLFLVVKRTDVDRNEFF